MMFNDLLKYVNNVITKEEKCVDINLLIKYMETSNLTISEKNEILRKAYSYNLKLTQKLSDEVDKIKMVESIPDLEVANIELQELSINRVNTNSCQPMREEIDITNYIELINSFDDLNQIQSLNYLIGEDKFDDTINQLLVYYALELVTLKRLRCEDRDNIFNSENVRIECIIQTLVNLQKSNQNDKSNITNDMIYLITASGEVSFLNSLNKISSTYYDTIKSIFDFLYNGNGSGVKINNGSDYPILELQNKSVSILYVKVFDNLNLLLDVFITRSQLSNNNRNYLREISKRAIAQKNNFLKMSMEDKRQFIKQNEIITNQIYSTLSQKKKVLK